MIRTNTSERKRALINSRIGQYQVSGFWDPKIFFVNKVNWYFNRIQFKHVQSMKLEKALSARSFFVTWNRVSLFSEDTMQTDCNTLFTRSEYLFYIINLFHPARLICINTPITLTIIPLYGRICSGRILARSRKYGIPESRIVPISRIGIWT